MSRRDPLTLAALAALVLGFLLLVVFDAWFTRLFGVLALFAFVVTGVFAIATRRCSITTTKVSPRPRTKIGS